MASISSVIQRDGGDYRSSLCAPSTGEQDGVSVVSTPSIVQSLEVGAEASEASAVVNDNPQALSLVPVASTNNIPHSGVLYKDFTDDNVKIVLNEALRKDALFAIVVVNSDSREIDAEKVTYVFLLFVF